MGTNTLSNYVRGKRVPDAVMLDRIARACNADLGWVVTGRATMPVRGSADENEPTVRVPIYAAPLGAARVGTGGEPSDEIVSYGDVWVEWLRGQARVNPKRAFIAPVYGASMLRLYANGDLVVGETVDELERDDTYALWHDDQLLIKHVRRRADGIDLVSENPSFPVQELRGDEVSPERTKIIGRIAGKVTGHIV